jgi:ubiquinone/menaquinone biosynthesis C-methylase UbiE
MGRVCPWWLGYLLASPLRRLLQHPEEILRPYVTNGMTVLDVGCGMGFFSLPLATLVGERGKVICVDLQEKMLSSLRRRAVKAGVLGRIETRRAEKNSLNLEDKAGTADFALVFAVAHEVPDQKVFLREIRNVLKENGKLLFSEPKSHVTEREFAATKSTAQTLGFEITDTPAIRRAHAAILVRASGH